MRFALLPPLALTSLSALSLPLAAQDAATSFTLDPIMIRATGLPVTQFDSASTVSVVTADDIGRDTGSVAELLADIPGIRIDEEGIQRLRIRGEAASRVAVKIDGQLLSDHSGYGQPILIDPAAIDRIEVIRGASSVAQGTQAVGGVINIITKGGIDRPFGGSVTAGAYSATGGFRLAADLGGSSGSFDWRLTLGRRYHGNRQTPDGELPESGWNDKSAAAHLGYRMGQHYVGIKAQAYDLSAKMFPEYYSPAITDFRIDLPERKLRKIGAFYEGTDLTPWLTTLRVDAYRQTIDRQFSNAITVMTPYPGAPRPVPYSVVAGSDDSQTMTGLNLRADLGLAPGQRTAIGLDYVRDVLDAVKLTSHGVAPRFAQTRRDIRASLTTTSVWAQHEVDLTPILTGTFGARWYHLGSDLDRLVKDGVAQGKASNGDSRWIGSAGLVWAVQDGLALRANLSQGYTYPTLQQLYVPSTGGGQTINPNADLKPEQSTTFELGARLDRDGTMLDATLFYSRARDYITKAAQPGPYPGREVLAWQNVESARSWGLELAAEAAAGFWGLRGYGNLTVMRRQLELASGQRSFKSGTPQVFGRIGLQKDWQMAGVDGSLDLFLRGAGRAEDFDTSEYRQTRAAGYATLNLATQVNLPQDVTMTIEALNLLNKSYNPIDEAPGAERSVNIMFNKRF
ncbi:TonB-dependent receptor plug domain-containing protein [Paracoccus sp. p1-h21]|uniref:TonB-dependent receptor plug domain-containing protein n=1 Tax=Paracoccus sp. p1-h21 TaxID=3366951 RepID=UPI00379A4A42